MALGLAAACGAPPPDRVLDVATTTSVRDSGLLDELLPPFSEETGIEVRLLVVGSGAALRMGADGDVDALVTHAPPGEEALVAEGRLVDRRPFMRNHFVLAGPAADPAHVRGAPDVLEALRRIRRANAPFVSRADDSGTHRREKALLQQAGLDPSADWPAVLRTNAGMGASLQVAGERRAYILADVGTFRAFREQVGLVSLSDPDGPAMQNIYSVSRPNPALHPEGRLNVEGAKRLADYLLAPATQERIAGFRAPGQDEPLFVPLALEEEPPEPQETIEDRGAEAAP